MNKCLLVLLLSLFPALNLLADEVPDFYRQALNFYLGNHYRNAGENLQIYYQGNPNDWRGHQLMGYCDYMLHKEGESLFECQASLKLNGKNPRLEAFVAWLKTSSPKEQRKSDERAYLEGREEAQMPPPPDEDPGREPDSYLTGQTSPLPTLTATPVPVTEGPDDLFRNVLFQLGPGMEFLGQNFQDNTGPGWGGELSVGYALDDHLSLWLSEAINIFSEYFPYYGFGRSYQFQYFETTLSARYAFGDGPFQPYVGAGVGVYAADGFYETHNLIQGSLGARLKLDPVLSLFVETKANFIFEPNPGFYFFENIPQVTVIDYPVNAGVILDFWGDKGVEGHVGAALPAGDFFIKTGWGFTFGTAYDAPAYTSVNNTSIAVGYDFPNHFSFFTSLERFPGDWALLANLQFSIWIKAPFEPYLFIGGGIDFPDGPPLSPMNNAGQAGVGLDIPLNRTMDLYGEVKGYSASNLGNFGSLYQTTSGIIETGLKFNFSSTRNPSPPTPMEPAHPAPGKWSVEMAGGTDLPAENWQSAYGVGSGGKFSVGYEFNDGLALQMEVEDFDYSGSNFVGSIGDNELLFLPTVRYALLHGGIRPYLSLGAGLDVEISWANGTSPGQADNLGLALGAGLEVPFDPLNSLFVEGKYNFIFADGTIGQDIPLLGGVRLGFH